MLLEKVIGFSRKALTALGTWNKKGISKEDSMGILAHGMSTVGTGGQEAAAIVEAAASVLGYSISHKSDGTTSYDGPGADSRAVARELNVDDGTLSRYSAILYIMRMAEKAGLYTLAVYNAIAAHVRALNLARARDSLADAVKLGKVDEWFARLVNAKTREEANTVFGIVKLPPDKTETPKTETPNQSAQPHDKDGLSPVERLTADLCAEILKDKAPRDAVAYVLSRINALAGRIETGAPVVPVSTPTVDAQPSADA